MSHKDETIICPNCGHHATGNYCSQCGQENHLHSETFFGLIMHFVGHYFHYDSKFWKTVAALLTKPGKLTVAYWNKQRMRYIPPISLYIFISVVYFLVYASMPSLTKDHVVYTPKNTDSVLAQAEAEVSMGKGIIHSLRQKAKEQDAGKSDSVIKAQQAKAELIAKKIDEDGKEIKEKISHMLPKIFFFLIPLMGVILLLLFQKRKELNYVSHVIFAMHYHTLWFMVMLAEQLYRFQQGHILVMMLLLLITVIYFVVALKNTYGIGWGRSLWYSFVAGFFYVVFLGIATVAVAAVIMQPYLHLVEDGAKP